MNPMDLRKGIKLASDHVVNVLSDISKPISTKEEVAQVGTISANRWVCLWFVFCACVLSVIFVRFVRHVCVRACMLFVCSVDYSRLTGA